MSPDNAEHATDVVFSTMTPLDIQTDETAPLVAITPNTLPGGVTANYAMPSKGRIVFINRPQPKHGEPYPADELVLPAIVVKASGGMINAMAFMPNGGFEFHTGVEHVNAGPAGEGVATWAWPPRT